MIPVYYIFNSLFSILLVLHIIWFYYIVKIAYKVSKSYILKRNTMMLKISDIGNWCHRGFSE